MADSSALLDRSATEVPPVIDMRDISISFPPVKALDGVQFRLFPGEIHALMGENGAGKSTLIKVLTGVYAADGGEITLSGSPISFSSPGDAQAAGISTVYQEVNLLPNLTVAENVLLGHEPRRFGGIDWPAMRRRAAEVLQRLHLDIDPASTLSSHSLAIQQLVSIGRAVDVDAKVLILDEPTSSLDSDEVSELFRVLRDLRDHNVAILFVSHFLDQVYEISDRLTVFRNGRFISESRTADLPRLELVHQMIGKELSTLDDIERRTQRGVAVTASAEPIVQAIGLGRRGTIEAFDLDVFPGEVIGVAGLLGSGRTELARILSGVDRADTGELRVDGQPNRFRSPRNALHRRIAYSSENRRSEGIIADLSVRDNIALAVQSERGWLRRIPRRRQDELAARSIEMLQIRPADPDALLRNLSGGNQQKVLLARWLATAPRLLILDEPTRGIDIGAKAEIQRRVAELAEGGMSVLFISAELEEVLRLSHRVLVMRDRHKVADVPNEDLDVNKILGIIADGAPA